MQSLFFLGFGRISPYIRPLIIVFPFLTVFMGSQGFLGFKKPDKIACIGHPHQLRDLAHRVIRGMEQLLCFPDADGGQIGRGGDAELGLEFLG